MNNNEEYIKIDEVIREVNEILSNVIRGKIDKSQVLKELSYVQNSVTEKMNIDNDDNIFTKNLKKRGHPTELPNRYKNLVYAFIALRRSNKTFDVVTRSKNNNINYSSAKSRNSTPKTDETMKKKEMKEIIGFITLLLELYNNKFTEEERIVFKKYFDEQGSDMFENYQIIYDFECELLFFIINFFENFFIYDNELLRKLNMELREINKIILYNKYKAESAEEQEKPIVCFNSTDLWSIYDVTYTALSHSIYDIFKNHEEDCMESDFSRITDNDFYEDPFKNLAFYNDTQRILNLKKDYYMHLSFPEEDFNNDWLTDYTQCCGFVFNKAEEMGISYLACSNFFYNTDHKIAKDIQELKNSNKCFEEANNIMEIKICDYYNEFEKILYNFQEAKFDKNNQYQKLRKQKLEHESLDDIHKMIDRYIKFE